MSGKRIQDPAVSSQVNCPVHDQTVKLYCYDCDHLICRDCTLVDHRAHRFEFLAKCAPKSRKQLGTLTVPLLKIQADITVAEKRLEKVDAKIDEQEAKVEAAIKAAFDKLRAALEEREVELMNKLGKMVQEKRSAVMEQSRVLQGANTEIQGVVDFVHQNLEGASNEELMTIRTELEANVGEEVSRHRNLPLQPKVVADIACDLPAAEPARSEVGDVFHASISQLTTAEVGQKSKLTLKIRGAKNLKLLHVNATLKSLANPDVATQVLVNPTGNGVYEIHYVPQVRGRHNLTVKVNDGDIPDSPFRLFVKIPPTKLGFPVLQSEKLGKPHGIAFTPKGELVVAENGGKKLTFMDKKCRKLRAIVTPQFHYPRGVAVSSSGTVFSTDKGAENTILKFVRMKLVNAVIKGSKSLAFVKIINDYLYVCDMGISEVHILTQDLESIGSFTTKEVPKPHDITEGEDGLYVVGGEESAKIGIYTHEGEFIRYFNISGNRSIALSVIRGICFDYYGNMFLTQTGPGLGGVFVFKPNGEYITSFGLVSNGMMDNPYGLAIDEDGFVYVADHKEVNRKVFVF